jgi:hypothetical protein
MGASGILSMEEICKNRSATSWGGGKTASLSRDAQKSFKLKMCGTGNLDSQISRRPKNASDGWWMKKLFCPQQELPNAGSESVSCV